MMNRNVERPNVVQYKNRANSPHAGWVERG